MRPMTRAWPLRSPGPPPSPRSVLGGGRWGGGTGNSRKLVCHAQSQRPGVRDQGAGTAVLLGAEGKSAAGRSRLPRDPATLGVTPVCPALPGLPCAFSLLSSEGAIIGFRDCPNLGQSLLKILTLITPAKTLFPNSVAFTGSGNPGVDVSFWRPPFDRCPADGTAGSGDRGEGTG